MQSRLSGNDLTTFLQSLMSDTIESIEIISNPSAQYEAEGSGGIINIRLKKAVARNSMEPLLLVLLKAKNTATATMYP